MENKETEVKKKKNLFLGKLDFWVILGILTKFKFSVFVEKSRSLEEIIAENTY